ncbi:hypothetical protein QBC46DRAFT_359509 [Diplogelasinospora grovesii]|uniref:Alpha/beta hydrolase fold-3 domain-containing protein n=1 Tax=Diplogelasinospora grovesii TaxID=303347 RepID=A0AAN6RZ07_9PEZI|nr:hypothetical protein QBC46DRAFT_359509 [Diplogelasinospora grovesii]
MEAVTTIGTTSADSQTTTVPRQPLSRRLQYGAIAFAIQKLLVGPITFLSGVKQYFSPPAIRPDVVKTYPTRKHLPVRIFYPKSYDRDSGERLPVLLTIHGGGFVVGSVHDNDDWNAAFASRHNFLVVALNYAKAPASPFPNPIYDIEALIGSVLSDSSLPIDASRVALAGWSAGGNLCLAAAQLDSVRSGVQAVIPLYPVVDFLTKADQKARARRYKPALGGFRARESDFLLSMSAIFNWAYLPPGHRYDDPLLSPYYATRETLPPNVFVIGCELDMLGHEDWRLACKLAGRREPGMDEVLGKEEVVGKGELVLDDERFAFASDDGRYRWLLVPDTIHGFDQNISAMVRDEKLMEDARMKTDKVIGIIGEWLLSGPLKPAA